uniref:Oligodendrocyte transcription factor 1 n=1 Tax=Sinocyclocheilus anshuiensis TaxID=1608454 RepID=A0A671KNR9_9TELE
IPGRRSGVCGPRAVPGFRCKEQGEGSLQELMPRMVWVTGAGGPSSNAGGLQGPYRSSKPPRELSVEEQQELRRKINSRERKRMQDLNVAMDALREVMVPYSSPTGVSGISTLVLARNNILLLGSSLQEMRRLLGEVSIGMGVSGTVPRLLLTGGWPFLTGPGQLLFSPPEQQMGAEPLAWGSGSMSESPVCQCGVSKLLQHLLHFVSCQFPHILIHF